MTVAQWGDDVYNKIYGNNKEAGTKEYYVGLVAYDGARKIPAVEGDKGNASTSFYLWDSLEAKIGTVKTSIGYKVMNGRSAATPDEYARWTSALNELKIEEPLKTHIEKNFLIKIENLKLIGVHHNSFDENVIFTLYCDCDKYISIETKKT